MATFTPSASPGPVARAARRVGDTLFEVGDFTGFCLRVLALAVWPVGKGAPWTPIFYQIGLRSVPVVAVTGLFIGMVLAVQAYQQFYEIGLRTQLGAIVNSSVVRELGPVLAATMLAGRVGSALAAELGTMRVTEQIDALACLGADPVQYLVVPRFLACVLLSPLLTVIANFMGVMGGALISTQVYHIDAHFYWQNARGFVDLYDVGVGLVKPTAFGAALALISCYQGFHSGGGAEGVGRAATTSFVASFISILAMDFFLALLSNRLYQMLYPAGGAPVV